jgi:DNA-binding CsgD family transcriptional regulator/tetratricopeptide (TPR) repeat protein
VLLERDAAVDALLEAVASVADGGPGRFVVVGGEAGVGKTSLLRRVAELAPDDVTVVWGACDSLSTPRALGPLFDIADAVGGELAELLRSRAPRETVYAGTLRFLSESPTLVFVEDAHWADEATIDLLTFLRRRVGTTRAVVVTTYRDDETGSGHPLRTALAGAPMSGEVRVDLEPLSLDAVAVLVGSSGPSAPAIHAMTGGNPFFVTELVSVGGSDLPRNVRDAVLARVARLSEPARAVLDAVAIVPVRAEVWLVDALVDALVDDPTRVASLDECVDHGVLLGDRDGVTFRHELARLAVRNAVAPVRRRRFHERALAALSDPPSGSIDEARLAHHAFEAGNAEAVLRWAPMAAAAAGAVGAHRQAADHLDHALRYAARLPVGEQIALWRETGIERHTVGDLAGATEAFRTALDLCRRNGDHAREGEILLRRSSVEVSLGRRHDAAASVDAGLALLEPLGPSPDLAYGYSITASNHMLAREFGPAREWGDKALDLAEALGRPDRIGHTLVQTGVALLMSGDDDGLARLRRGHAIATQLGDHVTVSLAFSQLGSGGGEIRRYDLAMPALEAGRAYAAEHEILVGWSYQSAWYGRCLLELGRWQEAAEVLGEVLASPWCAGITRMVAVTALGRLRARRGDPGVWDALDESLASARDNGHLQRVWPAAVARAEAAWLDGHLDTEVPALQEAHALAAEVAYGWALGELSEWLVRAGCRPAVTTPAAEPHRLALAGDHAAAARVWASYGCAFEAALVSVDSDDVDLVRRGFDTFDGLGSRPATGVAADRLRALGARAPRGPNASTLANAAGLTAREMDVLHLLVAGFRNAEIADRLVISSKTVDHHVSSVLAKAGVTTRQAAAAKAVRMGWVDPKDGESHR